MNNNLALNYEPQRALLQANLDSGKSSLERNRLGQFSTPPSLAKDIIDYALEILACKEINFLDPAFGTGTFYSALISAAHDNNLGKCVGYEIDEHYANPTRQLWDNHELDIRVHDFTKAKPDIGFNLVVCNPPYVRHHHLANSEKKRFKKEIKFLFDYSISGLSGLYCYFMLMAHQWMAKNAVAAWLVPSEFMDVNYGNVVKQYLRNNVTLLRIHRFNPSELQFNDALVTSSVVWFRNEKPKDSLDVEFSYGGTHKEPKTRIIVDSQQLIPSAKWSHFSQKRQTKASNEITLADMFKIRRGIATGCNDFFILTRQEIKKFDLPLDMFRPILPSPRYLKNDIVETDNNGMPQIDNPMFLLDCRLSEDEIRIMHPNISTYLESGKNEIASRYLCRTKNIWYLQESREPTPFLCSYMGRSSKSSSSPIRFILNYSNAIAANSYLMLYLKPEYKNKYSDKKKFLHEIWSALQEITTESLLSEGRVYGGGLHKMEPKELAKVPATSIAKLLKITA